MSIIDKISIFKKKVRSKKTSYSFGGVDLIVDYFFKNRKKGVYLDIGCQHPVSNNNTYLLYKRGWRGVNIDLDKKNIHLFNLSRFDDLNINAAISSKKTNKKLFFYHAGSAINTLEKTNAKLQKAKYKEIKTVITTTINDILITTPYKKIDYVSIDVEGHELDVLKGFNLKKYLPDIVSIEFLDFSMKKLEFKNNKLNNVLSSKIYKYMIKNGYSFINWCHADLIFVRNKIRD